MRLTIPITPSSTARLPRLLETLSAHNPGPGHQVFITTVHNCNQVAEKFASDVRRGTKFGGVVLSVTSPSLMTGPDNYLWATYFSAPHPDTLWLGDGAEIVGSDGWLSKVEDELRFATSFLIGPQTLHTTGVYRAGASKRLQAWRCPCLQTSLPPHLSHSSALNNIYRPSSMFHVADSLDGAPAAAFVVIPSSRQGFVPAPTPAEKVDKFTPQVTPEVTPEVTPQVDAEPVKVDTPPVSEVSVAPQAPARIVRRAKP